MTSPAAGLWDILITTIPHRHEKLCGLLAELDRQIWPGTGTGVRIWRDNLEHSYGEKCQALTDSSAAEYISFIDDDDQVATGFVARVTGALRARPDYVGFPVWWTRNGQRMVPVEHSLRHCGWSGDETTMLRRDITQFNPIRRDLALLGRWEGGNRAEVRWASGVRDSGKCVTEAWIDEPMYYYRENTADTFETARVPWSEPLPELPPYPWLTVIAP